MLKEKVPRIFPQMVVQNDHLPWYKKPNKQNPSIPIYTNPPWESVMDPGLNDGF